MIKHLKKYMLPIICMLLFIFLTYYVVAFSDQKGMTDFDIYVYEIVSKNISDVNTIVMKTITNLSFYLSVYMPLIITFVNLILLVIFEGNKNKIYNKDIDKNVIKCRRRYLLFNAFYLSISSLIFVLYLSERVLKGIIARPRPDILQLVTEKSYSFPSSHALSAGFIFLMLVEMLIYSLKNKNKFGKKTYACMRAIVIVFTITVAYTRVYLGVHNATDVIAGLLIGYALYFVCANVYVDVANMIKDSKDSMVL